LPKGSGCCDRALKQLRAAPVAATKGTEEITNVSCREEANHIKASL